MKYSTISAVPVLVVLLAVGALTVGGRAFAADKQDFTAGGEYVEGCSCPAICPCEIAGVKMGCLGVGAMKLTSGTYKGTDLTGAKIAYATQPGTWVRIYVEPASADQLAGLKAFASAIYSGWGKIEAVKAVKIAFDGADGKYTVTVSGGATMKLSTTPVLGADKKTAVSISNVNDPLNSSFYQGKTVSGSFKDGTRTFTLKGTNSFFNNTMNASGKI